MCLVRPSECGLCGAYAAAVSAVALALVAVCDTSACARLMCVNVIKRRITACAYSWARCGYGVYDSGYRVQGDLVLLQAYVKA